MTYLVNRPARRRNLMTAPVYSPFYLAPTASRHRTPQVPMNLTETDEAYELTLAAPGLKKEYFHLEVQHDLLSVKLELPEENGQAPSYTYREFVPSGFERRFRLSEQIDAEQISATYQDGMLKLTLPKRPEVNQSHSITVQ